MKFIKDNWLILAFVFQLGIAFAGYLDMKDTVTKIIDNKLDRREYERIRERDSLRQIIKDLELIKIKREINPAPETTKQRDTTTIKELK